VCGSLTLGVYGSLTLGVRGLSEATTTRTIPPKKARNMMPAILSVIPYTSESKPPIMNTATEERHPQLVQEMLVPLGVLVSSGLSLISSLERYSIPGPGLRASYTATSRL